MEDTIYRQQALALRFTKAINEDGVIYVPLGEYLSGIESLPPAQPERKKGKWIPDEIAAYDMPKGEPRGWVPWLCSECGWSVGKHQTAFCPSCGADMRGEQNDIG